MVDCFHRTSVVSTVAPRNLSRKTVCYHYHSVITALPRKRLFSVASRCLADVASKHRLLKMTPRNLISQNLRGVRASKAQELNAHLEILGQAMRSYTAALKTTGECLDNLEGDQLLAMEPDLRSCLEKHEGDFPSLKLEPYVDDRVEFAYDRDVAYALRLGISKIGYLAPIDTDAQDAPDKRVKVAHLVPRDVHFTLAAIMGRKRPDDVAFETPSDTVVVEMRNGSEQNFLKTGVEGPVVGRVILRTQLKGANFLAYESENFFESLSQRNATALRKEPPCDNGIPTVRFTKTLRVTGRRGERSKSMRSQSMSRISRSTRREVLRHSHYY